MLIITGDLIFVTNDQLRHLISKGPKYRVPTPSNMKQDFKLLMESVEDNARQWEKREKVEVDTLFEWVKTVRSLKKVGYH